MGNAFSRAHPPRMDRSKRSHTKASLAAVQTKIIELTDMARMSFIPLTIATSNHIHFRSNSEATSSSRSRLREQTSARFKLGPSSDGKQFIRTLQSIRKIR